MNILHTLVVLGEVEALLADHVPRHRSLILIITQLRLIISHNARTNVG